MKSSRGHNPHEYDEDYDEDFSSQKQPSSTNKDAKSSDKATAIRSKHSVTEQRRRSKINERFQILRDLIPHGDQKRDTASFLLEVIEHVQILQEKVQKYEGSYQGWSTEPTKLVPWRHNHWRVQNYLGHPQAIKNGLVAAPTSSLLGKFDEKNFSSNPALAANGHTTVEADSDHDAFRMLDQSDLGENAATMPTSFQVDTSGAVQFDGDDSHFAHRASDSQSASCAIQSDDQSGEHMIEGGTISISSAYSHELLMALTQGLQSSGVDLSQASISIRIDLGKRVNTELLTGISGSKELQNPVSQDLKLGDVDDGSTREEFDQPMKKLKQ